MTTVRVDVEPDLLGWAVRRARWDEETTHRRAPRLDAWVTGAARPTLKQIEKFAADTHTPFGHLFLPEPPVENLPIPDMRTMRDAGVDEPSAELLETIYLCQRRQDRYRDEVINSGASPLGFIGSATLSTPVEEAAARIRSTLHLDGRSMNSRSEAMTDLIARAETIGVLVMVNGVVDADTHRRLDPEEFRGFVLADDVAPLIFVNGADTKAAQIFTLVHELAHLWLGRSALSDADTDARGGQDEERWCNQVAAKALVPLNSLRDEWDGTYGEDELDRLGRPFTRAVVSSALEGRTTYRDAYRLLGTAKHSTFEDLAEKVGVA
ncbi:ImmA/IrrE family metallo-endopeptidase [Actinomyces respiraculi]|uniref:ImmA/IrrE family metallo-endopeptidase n=1 Tax=Actinomyces respiraculi TaxID=2744574 RepID=UPI00142324EF|nr:ImmA/IrrE family metallo-endopeptidase [Actinomyces respiraculi]